MQSGSLTGLFIDAHGAARPCASDMETDALCSLSVCELILRLKHRVALLCASGWKLTHRAACVCVRVCVRLEHRVALSCASGWKTDAPCSLCVCVCDWSTV